jgi:cell division cycle protein 20 (cofactor of APC complex)
VILDCPNFRDDFYLNILDWNASGVLAIALESELYLVKIHVDRWSSGAKSSPTLLTSTHGRGDFDSWDDEHTYVSAVRWAEEGRGSRLTSAHIAVATSSGAVEVWDAAAQKRVRTLRHGRMRIGSLSWNGPVISSGSRDGLILNHDTRAAEHREKLVGHAEEICGLAWSPDGCTLASGGNDNLVCLWDARRSGGGGGAQAGASTGAQRARCTLAAHLAAVKALAWCPFRHNVLASGGGTADKCIKFWNAGNGACLNSVDTGSQVCSLLWSPHEKELVSSHGFSDNQLCLWRYPSMQKITELKGHTARVLHLCASPDGATVCSAGADETLRFWNIFGGRDRKRSKKANGSRMFGGMALR